MGSMARSFYVGENVRNEDIEASYEDGILRLTVPKKELETQDTKYITIK